MLKGIFAWVLLCTLASAGFAASVVAPKVLIVTLFEPEREAWLSKMPLDRNVTVHGLSPLFPHVSCDHNGEVCLVTTGEGEINAASTISALCYSMMFDLRKTYILVNGIAGVNPEVATMGSAGFARFAVQVGLQYGIDARQAPNHWNYTFWNYGTKSPGKYPGLFYGSEVFEVNTNLRDKVFDLVKDVQLHDNAAAKKLRATYPQAKAKAPPALFKGDITTSDLYFTGKILYVCTITHTQRTHGSQLDVRAHEWHGHVRTHGTGG